MKRKRPTTTANIPIAATPTTMEIIGRILLDITAITTIKIDETSTKF